MARIKITDLPKDKKIGKEEMRRVRGGAVYVKMPGTGDHKMEYAGLRLTAGMKMDALPTIR